MPETQTPSTQKTLEARRRTERGSRACARIRARGDIPAVAYAKGKENVHLTVPLLEFAHHLAEGERVFHLAFDGGDHTVLVKEVQHGTYDHEIIHADFEIVSLTTTVHVPVEIHLVGTAKGTKVGGVVEQELYEMDVECLAGNIPQRIEVEITDLDVEDIIHVREVPTLPEVKYLNGPDTPVVLCHMPAGEEEEEAEEEAAEEAAAGEPEVIGERAEGQEASEGDQT